MNRIINEIFKRKKILVTLFLIVLGYGIYAYYSIPKQEMPDMDTPYMAMYVVAPSMSASEIEGEVNDIEKVILTYSDVIDVRTTIYDSYAVIITTYTFSSENPDQLSEDIFNKVNTLELSQNIESISYTSSFDDPHIIYAIHSDSLEDLDLVNHAQHFKNELVLIDEIESVEMDSVFNKEVVITLDQDVLEMYQLSITDIYYILYAATIDIPLGGIYTNEGFISVTGDFSIDDVAVLEDIIIIPGLEPVLLKNIGSVNLEDTSYKQFSFNGEPCVFLSVYFKEDVDFTKMDKEMKQVKETFLIDSEVSISDMLYLPDYVQTEISNVFNSLLIAIGIVMIIVLIGIGVRNSILIVLTAPIILFGTIGVLYISGFELHKLTIVGLIVSIGILVDNQIVITEGIKRNIDYNMSKVEASKKAIIENVWPVLSSTLTTIAAFIVLVLLPGFLGEIVSSMPLTVIITLSISFIVSMTLSPVLAILFLKPSKKEYKISIHQERIKKMIKTTIKFPYIWISISILLLIGSTYMVFTTQPIDLYPNDERSVLYIDFEHDTLGDINETITLSNEIIDYLEENPHVLNYALSIGGDLPNFHFSSKRIDEQPHIGRLYINFDYTEQELLLYKETLEKEFTNLVTVNTLELSPPVAPVRVIITSDEIIYLDQLKDTLYQDIASLDNVKSYKETSNVSSLKYSISYDTISMSNQFISKAEIDQLIAITLNGYQIDGFMFNDDSIYISLKTNIESIYEIYDIEIKSTLLDISFSLDTFITIEEKMDYRVIERYSNKNVNILELYPTNDSDNISLENDILDIVSTYDTSNVTIEFSGENMLFEEISEDIIKASIIAVVLIFIIMFFQFNNFVKPLIVLLTIPLSFSGSFLFLILFNSPITATSLVGMVSLIGVTVNTGILLVEYISRRVDKEGIEKACIDSVYLRFRPVMLTSATTVLGLIPLLLTGGNFFRPMAITFMGGMITSTLITIFLVPSVYYMLYKKTKAN